MSKRRKKQSTARVTDRRSVTVDITRDGRMRILPKNCTEHELITLLKVAVAHLEEYAEKDT